MAAKLQRTAGNYLRIPDDAWWLKKNFAPHLVYANLKFGDPKSRILERRLLRWLGFVGPFGWTNERTVKYLQAHQSQFRDCIDWLSRNAEVNLGFLRNRYESSPDDIDVNEYWAEFPQVRFLQLHGLDHPKIGLKPSVDSDDPLWFAGLQLEQRKPRDPLDPLCWYLLHLLMRDGTIHIRRCRYQPCGKCFVQRTLRKRYCCGLCRAKDHMKSPQQMRLYMRDYRKKRKQLRRAALPAKSRNARAKR